MQVFWEVGLRAPGWSLLFVLRKILLLWIPLKLFQLRPCITGSTLNHSVCKISSGWVLINSPGTWDMFEAADRTVCEATLDNFKVPLSTETLNTTHTDCARGLKRHLDIVFTIIKVKVWKVLMFVTLFSSAHSFGGKLSSRISFLEEL